MAIVDSWSLFKGHSWIFKMGPEKLVVFSSWSLFGDGGCELKFDCIKKSKKDEKKQK